MTGTERRNGVGMAAGGRREDPPHTILEQKLVERNQTHAEFAKAAEGFALRMDCASTS